eukprot:708990_1
MQLHFIIIVVRGVCYWFKVQKRSFFTHIKMNPPQPQVVNNAFAVMVPGQPLNTNCVKINGDKYVIDINNPGLISSFGITVLNPNTLPKNIGFAIYYSLNNQDFEFVGVIHRDYPSAIFNSPWLDIKGITGMKMVRIGFELKSTDFLKSLKDKSEQEAECKNNMLTAIKTEFAMKVAENLYNYMSSYVKPVNNGSANMIVAPEKCLNAWHDRFKTKYIMDPKFMKSG